MKKCKNFGAMIEYIKKYILLPETKEVEADDLTVVIYPDEVVFQINALYDGMEYTYNSKENKVTCECATEKAGRVIDLEEAMQMGRMMTFLEMNKKTMAKFLK